MELSIGARPLFGIHIAPLDFVSARDYNEANLIDRGADMKENISKEQFIKATYEILSKEGIQALSIRRLGKVMDCNPANIYRYFTGMDELVLYASLQFLRGYLKDVASCFERIQDGLKLHFAVWRCFAESSFERPEIFDNLFFGKYSARLDQIMKEYYQMYPEELPDIYAETGEIIAGLKPGRERKEERIVCSNIGMSVCDVAMAKFIFDSALERNLGTVMKL